MIEEYKKYHCNISNIINAISNNYERCKIRSYEDFYEAAVFLSNTEKYKYLKITDFICEEAYKLYTDGAYRLMELAIEFNFNPIEINSPTKFKDKIFSICPNIIKANYSDYVIAFNSYYGCFPDIKYKNV